ncbi:MAG TPA: Hpt domain-containing protein [Vicinamibacterales bacterium]|jgi:chemotaxis protein histidine kinase CheA
MMPEPDDEMAALLASMRVEFLETATDRVATIRAEADRLAIAAEPIPGLTTLIREAHTLKGGGATFGFPSLTDAGGEVETQARILAAAGTPLPPVEPLHAAVAVLEATLASLKV